MILAVMFFIFLTGCGNVDNLIRGDSKESGGSGSGASSSAASSSTPPLSNSPPSQNSATNSSGSKGSGSASSSEPDILTITIPEGYTLARIGMLLEEKGICTAAEFIDAAEIGDFSEYSFISGQAPAANRCFELEGYLFPDTYQIYRSETPDDILRRLLSNTESRLSPVISAAGNSGYTLDQIITMASIIEKEALGSDQMSGISSVLRNRINLGMKLECDVTINYVEGAIKPFISGDINRYNSDYNTYKCAALPAGAICNPGMAAIEAALNPIDSEYLFFVTDKNENIYFSSTYEEHAKRCDELGIVIPGV